MKKILYHMKYSQYKNTKDIDFQIKWEFDDVIDTAVIELLLNISRIYE